VTVEDVSDEDEPGSAAKKKKKKPKKKKKKKPSVPEATIESEETLIQPVEPAPAPTPDPTPALTPAPAPSPAATTPRKKTPVKQPAGKVPSVKSVATSTAAYGSTASLPLPTEQTAQSAHAYLKQTGLDSEKTKVKTRADHATLFSIDEKADSKRGIFSRFKKEKNQSPEVDDAGKQSFFSNLKRKSKDYMKQILSSPEDKRYGSTEMRWSHFVKVRISISELELCLIIMSSRS
jgi:hypothetical protein